MTWHLYRIEELSLVDVALHEIQNDYEIHTCILIVDRQFLRRFIYKILKTLNEVNCKYLKILGKYWNRIRKICKKNLFGMELSRIHKKGDSFTTALDDVYNTHYDDKKEGRTPSHIYLISNDEKRCLVAASYLCCINRITCYIDFGEPLKSEDLRKIDRKHLYDYLYADIIFHTVSGEQITGRVVEVLKEIDNPDSYSGLIIRKPDDTTISLWIDDMEDLSIQESGQWPYSDQLTEYIGLWEQGIISTGTNFQFDVEKIPVEQR